MNTKERIKGTALSLFAKQGYKGTTMNEIADGVGIKKASLYAHFKGKEELFFAVYEDLAREYTEVMERMIKDSEKMTVQDRLYYLFEQYIIYYLRNPEVQAFWNQILFFTPPDLSEKFFSHVIKCDSFVRQTLEDIFAQGVSQGLLRDNNVKKMTLSFRALREGLLNGILIFPEMKENIKDFWTDYWLGIKWR